jgi:hypothetical protein
MPSDRDRDRLQATRERARISPLRSWMLDLYEQDPSRSMEPTALLEELTCAGWDATLSQVNYHLRKLQEAQLVPAPCPGS